MLLLRYEQKLPNFPSSYTQCCWYCVASQRETNRFFCSVKGDTILHQNDNSFYYHLDWSKWNCQLFYDARKEIYKLLIITEDWTHVLIRSDASTSTIEVRTLDYPINTTRSTFLVKKMINRKLTKGFIYFNLGDIMRAIMQKTTDADSS